MRNLRSAGTATAALVLVAAGLIAGPTPAAFAAGEQVNIWLTTTSDAGGRTVTRGLQQQTPVNFAATSGAANQTITVNEGTTYQTWEGAAPPSPTARRGCSTAAARSARPPGTR